MEMDNEAAAAEALLDIPASADTLENLQKLHEFQSWGRKIKPLFQLLAKSPSTALEIRICGDENQLTTDDPLLKDPRLIMECKNLFDQLKESVNKLKSEAKQIWMTLQEQWKELDENEDFQLTYTYAESGVIKALQDLHGHFILRETEKRERIAAFIGELRSEISKIWDLCMITEEEKANFKEFYIGLYDFSEDLLDIHKNELAKWQIYHEKNQEILVKIKRREEMWKKLRELESRGEDPNRFVNRGGALLKDQNRHNFIMKNLPKLEAELVNLAEQFEKEHDRKMKILGNEIPSMIEQEWKIFKEEKAMRKHARANPATSVSSKASAVQSRPRQSLMPVPGSSSSRNVEKRPASKPAGWATPLAKRRHWESKDSLHGNDN